MTSPAARILTWTLGVFAALALWLVIFGLLLSGLVESHAQSGLYDRFRGELAAGTAPLGGQVADGAPVALLSSPAADLDDVVVVEGSTSDDLCTGPGHYPGTPLPGQAGDAVVLGRATSFGAPFGSVAQLHRGDVITVVTGQGRFRYHVLDVRGPGDPVPEAVATATSQMTLVTAGGSGWRSGWAPDHVVYVDAVLAGRPVAAPEQLAVPSTRDTPLAHDTSGLYPLVLWLQLLLVASVGGVWLRSRSGVVHAWLLAVPVGLAALWGASQEAWLLLPNLL